MLFNKNKALHKADLAAKFPSLWPEEESKGSLGVQPAQSDTSKNTPTKIDSQVSQNKAKRSETQPVPSPASAQPTVQHSSHQHAEIDYKKAGNPDTHIPSTHLNQPPAMPPDVAKSTKSYIQGASSCAGI